MIERNRCCLCSRCVRAARSLCQICIMGSVSLLQCMLLRGLPAVASSRSLFTNAFLFSSSSWLGIRPALPPSMWQACYQHTARAFKAVACSEQWGSSQTLSLVSRLMLQPHHSHFLISAPEWQRKQNFSNWLWRKTQIKVFRCCEAWSSCEGPTFASIMSLRSFRVQLW